MKKHLISLSVALCATVGLYAQTLDYVGLKHLVGDDFKIGAALTPLSVQGPEAAMITHNFTTMTAENAMKPASLMNKDGVIDFTQADIMIEFARKNHLQMRGHTLAWHGSCNQAWFNDENGNPLPKEVFFEWYEKYIKAVLEHFPADVVFCWDVVNEALSDVEGELYRTRSPWYRTCGPDFIEWAFRTARKYAPANVKLYYNDYNLVDPAKRERAYTMLKGLIDKGVPIDGVGMQSHWDNSVTEEQIQACIDRFSSLGLDIQFTELDLTCFDNFHGPGAAERQKITRSVQYDTAMSKAQADEYEMIFRVFHKNAEKISSVTFWNLSDRSSWLNNFTIRGRLDYPLLFDAQYRPKEAYYRVAKLYRPELFEDAEPGTKFKNVPEAQGAGPYKVSIVSDASLPYFTIYRPEDLGAAVAAEGRLPVFLFGNGGCATSSKGYEPFLTEVASHGYIAIAIGPLPGSSILQKRVAKPSGAPAGGMGSMGADDNLLEAADWIIAQNGDEDSDYYHCIDIDKIATGGHSCGGAQALAVAYDPRVKTVLVLNSGIGDMSMAGATKAVLNELHGPMLYVVGGESDVAYPNAALDYDRIPSDIPVYHCNYPPVGHGGTYSKPNGGLFAEIAVNWLDWRFKDSKDGAAFFLKGKGTKAYPELEIKSTSKK